MSTPLRWTSPASCAPGTDSCIRFRIRRNVDLPQPDGPIRAVTVAAGMARDTRSSTLFEPNQAEMDCASSRAGPRVGAAAGGGSRVSSVVVTTGPLHPRRSPNGGPVPGDGADPVVAAAATLNEKLPDVEAPVSVNVCDPAASVDGSVTVAVTSP